MSARLQFVKGHCGWDVVTLLPAGQIPPEAELPVSRKILTAPINGGLEVGWLSAGTRPGEINVRMVNSTTLSWIPMCGGMTQVIGKALVETFLGDYFRIAPTEPLLRVSLGVECGEIPIEVHIRDGGAVLVQTTMDSYLSHLYASGVESLCLEGIPLLRVGKYAVMHMKDLETCHPDINFARRDPGPHLDIIHQVLAAFASKMGFNGVNGMLYDQRPEGRGELRVFPRFYSRDLVAARIPWEFQCGTGSIAVAAALAWTGQLSTGNAGRTLLLEWGSYRTTPDPYGIRTSEVEVAVLGRQIAKARFSHSVVEILEEGHLTVPAYSA